MLIAVAIFAVVVVCVGVVILWRSTPDDSPPDESDQNIGSSRLIDIVPPGPGGSG